MPQGIIAVHCGAGKHSKTKYAEYNKLSKRSCRKGVMILKNGGTALEAIRAAVEVLENDISTNSGYGSNLTMDGTIEVDASIMDGKTLNFGGCGAVKKLKNPIKLAYDLCIKQNSSMPLGLIPPSLLVDTGAVKYAKSIGLKTVNSRSLISKSSLRRYEKYKNLLKEYLNEIDDESLLDTVGAVCMDLSGNVAAACSSGGILLKRCGRVGQAALYGSGTWADSFDNTEPSIAVCTSGCGEHLVQTQLAKEIANAVKFESCPTIGLHNSIHDNFINSRFLKNVDQKLGGALVFHRNNNEQSLLWGHSTETMSIGYMRTDDKKPTALVSELTPTDLIGKTVTVSGKYFYDEEKNT